MSAGQVIGEVLVPNPRVDVPDATMTAREAMVRALLAYLAPLWFRHPGTQGERFRIKERNLLSEWPDPEHKLEYPTICVPASPGSYEDVGFTPSVLEESYGVYAPRTALVQLYEYVEVLQVTIWAANRGERRAVLAKLEGALSPMEDRHGLMLTTEGYYDRAARFTLLGSTLVEDEAVRGSRRADVSVEGRIPVVRLAAFNTLKVGTFVEDFPEGEEPEVAAEPAAVDFPAVAVLKSPY